MKKKIVLIILIFLCINNFICAKKSKKQETKEEYPAWITDEGRLKVFPDNQFVSQVAYGNTDSEAKEKALSNISEFIKSSVTSMKTSDYSYFENQNNFSEKKDLTENIEVKTDNTLYCVQYTNPYFYKELGQFVCVAYINRSQAFDFVKPKMFYAREQFPVLYENALQKETALEKVLAIKKAHKVLIGFYEVYDFARAVSPLKSKTYEDLDLLSKSSVTKMKELASSVLIKIQARGDVDLFEKSGVKAELANQFEKFGFIVSDSLKYNCLVSVELKSEIKKTGSTFSSFPEMQIKLIEKGKEVVSFSKQLKKVSGFDKDTVARRVNTAFVNEIKNSFIEESF